MNVLRSWRLGTLRTTILFVLVVTGAFGIRSMLLTETASAQTSQTYNWKSVVTDGGGGFVPGIVFNTSTPNLIYARTDIGGAYRWNPSTSSWIPLMDWVSFDEWNLMGVDSLATDPVDPNRLYILAGTYTNEWTTMNGVILRSTNRGDSFLRTSLPFKSGGNMPGRSMGERLAIDPNRNSTIYLGARSGNGLWRSTDFGANWSRVLSFTALGNYVQQAGDVYLGDPVGVVWVTFDPRTGSPGNTTQTIYVGVADKGNSVYRSSDGGTTWAAVPGQPTGFLPHHGVLSTSDGMLYITYSDGAGPYDGGKGDVWKFNTATGAWTRISPIPSDAPNGANYFGYGGLAIDAQRPGTIMVSALNSWWPDTILFRSTNGGATWTQIWDWGGSGRTFRYQQDIGIAPWLTLGANPPPPEVSPKLGWMVGDLEIDPFNSSRMMYGTGATIYGCDDLVTWDTGGTIHITVKAKGLEETSVQELISPPSGAPLLSALGDVNGYRHNDLSVAPSTVFTTPNTSSSTSIDFAELTPNFIVRVGNVDKTLNPQINRCGFSFDGGANWFQGQEPGGVTGGGNVAANANGTRVVWSPDGAAVNVSSNNGGSWSQSSGIPNGARVAADRFNPNKFYGFSNGTFYLSSNGGTSFTAAATGLPGFARIKAVPGREGDVWVAGGEGGLWRSINSGATFTRVTAVQEADNIGFGMAAPGQSYLAMYSSAQVGGVRGIFRSDDTGTTWIRINDDQHQYGSTNASITGDPRVFGRVYVSTNGRGIIVGEPSGVANPDFSLSRNPTSLTVNRGASGTSTVTITRTGGFASAVSFTASGLPTGVTATFNPTTTTTTGTSTVLTLAASSTAAAGPATVTVTGTGGGLTRTTTIALTVNAPDFSLSANPTSLTVNRGASGTSTVTIARTGGFASAVSFTASGLPTGVTATFNPATTTTTGTSTVVTLAASSTATIGAATVTVTGTSGSLSRTTTINLTVNGPDFSLAANPTSLTVNRGASGTSTVTVTRIGGFTGSVAFSATGLPAGVTATFNPTSTTGTSTILTLAASSTATLGAATVTVTGTAPGLTRTTTVALTVNGPDFTLAANPTSLTVNRGASGTSTVTVTRIGGFTGSVAFSATGLPAGVTATFNPTSTTGTSTVLTLAASSTATLAAATVTVTGTAPGLTRTTTVALTVNPVTTETGGVTITPVVSANGQWFNELQLRLSNTGTLTALSITVVIQRTTGVSHSGQFNTVGTQIQQSNTSTTTTITYQFTLAAGQTLGTGTKTFAMQMSGNGPVHPTAGDTYTVTYTTGGVNYTQSGHF